MTVWEHLRELRKRLLLAVAGVLVFSVVGWYLTPWVLAYIQAPLADLPGGDPQLNFQTIGGALDLRIRLAVWVGVIISSPWWIYQVGAFIWPGLRRTEKLHALGFGVVGVVLFLAGSFAGVVFAPHAITLLVSFVPQDAVMLLRADAYINFYIRLVAAFGVSFLVPVVLVALSFAGLITWRGLVKAWRWAVVGAFLIAAIINPIPNPLPMIIQALGLVALYFLAVGVAYLRQRAKEKKHTAI